MIVSAILFFMFMIHRSMNVATQIFREDERHLSNIWWFNNQLSIDCPKSIYDRRVNILQEKFE